MTHKPYTNQTPKDLDFAGEKTDLVKSLNEQQDSVAKGLKTNITSLNPQHSKSSIMRNGIKILKFDESNTSFKTRKSERSLKFQMNKSNIALPNENLNNVVDILLSRWTQDKINYNGPDPLAIKLIDNFTKTQWPVVLDKASSNFMDDELRTNDKSFQAHNASKFITDKSFKMIMDCFRTTNTEEVAIFEKKKKNMM